MRPKHLVSIVLIAVVLVMLMRNNNSMTNARPLVYRESLDEVAAQINGETLTLRDMAFMSDMRNIRFSRRHWYTIRMIRTVTGVCA